MPWMLPILLLVFVLAVVDAAVAGPRTLSTLRSQVETDELPLFQFSRDMSALLCETFDNSAGSENSNSGNNGEEELQALSELEFQVVFNDYMSRLRDHYSTLFLRALEELEGSEDPKLVEERKEYFIKECRIAMAASVPKHRFCSSWTFDGALGELEQDLDQIIRERADRLGDTTGRMSGSPTTVISVDDHASSLLAKARRFWRKNKWLRWVLSQGALLGFNFIQAEVVSSVVTNRTLTSF